MWVGVWHQVCVRVWEVVVEWVGVAFVWCSNHTLDYQEAKNIVVIKKKKSGISQAWNYRKN